MLTPNDLIKGTETELIIYMKKEFNQRIERLKKAEEFYNNPKTTDAAIERSYNTLKLILSELQKIGNEIESLTGEEITIDIANNGFKGV